MRPLLAMTLLLAMVGRTAYAGNCQIPVAPGGGGDDDSAGLTAMASCVPPRDPPEDRCPVNFPVPTNARVCQCKADAGPSRCNGGLSQAACNGQTANAVTAGLLTADAQTWLTTNGWCPIVIAGALAGICPNGCFAPETQILTTMTSDGTASYTSAAQLAPHTPMLTLSDDSGLDAIGLVSRPVSRVVSGPEEPPLFVFALSNGTTLRVTSHHPMVLDNGVITQAEDVAPGSAFVGIDGEPVKVTAITREPAAGNVFNYETDGQSQLSHVMVADGVLLGDLKLQNELSAEDQLIELRR